MSAEHATRFAHMILEENHVGKFRLDVPSEDTDLIESAFRQLGCRVTRDLFRLDVMRITPPAQMI